MPTTIPMMHIKEKSQYLTHSSLHSHPLLSLTTRSSNVAAQTIMVYCFWKMLLQFLPTLVISSFVSTFNNPHICFVPLTHADVKVTRGAGSINITLNFDSNLVSTVAVGPPYMNNSISSDEWSLFRVS